MSIVLSTQYFDMGPQNSKSSKYWANDEYMTGLSRSTKILLKI